MCDFLLSAFLVIFPGCHCHFSYASSILQWATEPFQGHLNVYHRPLGVLTYRYEFMGHSKAVVV